MCIILFQWQPDTPTPLIVAANRDEFYQRPTLAAAWRGDIFCGLDQRAGGTWIGVNRQGRFAAITNFREAGVPDKHWQSRGNLPLAFLKGNDTPRAYLQKLAPEQHRYGPFNLLVGTPGELYYLSNRGAAIQTVPAGIHGLSNGLLDAPWPKVQRGKQLLQNAITAGASPDQLLAVLTDRHQPADQALPNTGIPMEMERMLATIFIEAPGIDYGTRCSTLLTLAADGSADIREHIWH